MRMRARPDSGCGQPGRQVYRRRQRQDEPTAVTEALKAGWAGGWGGVVPGAAVATVGCGWPLGPGIARPGEQAATHSTVSAAGGTTRPRYTCLFLHTVLRLLARWRATPGPA